MSPGPTPPPRSGSDLDPSRVGRPLGRRVGHAPGRHHRGAGRRVDLLVVVQLDDLGGLEERSGELGEPHHQHRADREVGRDDAVARGEQVSQLVELDLAESGRSHDRVHLMHRAPAEVAHRRVGRREIDCDLGVRVGERARRVGDRDAGRNEITGVKRVDGGDELEGRIGRDGFAHGRAHASSGTEHPDPRRHAPHVTHRRYGHRST